MTRLAHPVTRETPALVRDRGRVRPIMVTLSSAGIYLRQKGTRTAYLLPYAAAYSAAVKLEVELVRRRNRRTRGGARETLARLTMIDDPALTAMIEKL